MWTMNFQMFKLALEKQKNQRSNWHIHWIIKKAREFQKNIYFCFIDYAKIIDCWITTKCRQFWKRWEYQTIWPILRNLYSGQEATVRTGYGTTDWFHIEKGVGQGCVLSSWLLTYMHNTSWETLGWMKHKLESRLPVEISITSDTQMTPPLWQEVKKNKRASWWKRRVKCWLKNPYSENKDHGIWYHHFRANRWRNSGNSDRLYFYGLQNHCR